jgi:hypothetical protein
VRAVPLLCEFFSGICPTAEEKAWKNLNQGKIIILLELNHHYSHSSHAK